jgi:hypothetical protein
MKIKKFFESFEYQIIDYLDYIQSFLDSQNIGDYEIESEEVRKEYLLVKVRTTHEICDKLEKFLEESKNLFFKSAEVMHDYSHASPWDVVLDILVVKKEFWKKSKKFKELEFKEHYLNKFMLVGANHYKDENVSIVTGPSAVTGDSKFELMVNGEGPIRTDSWVEVQFWILESGN